MPQISKSFELPTPRLLASASGLRGRLEWKVTFFLGERIIALSPTTHIKLVAIPLIALHHFLALAFSPSIAFIIHCSMVDTTIHVPAAPIAPSASADDSGHDSGAESVAMAASSPTRGATRMVAGEIPKLTDFFK
jgi:hypothetical protein